MDKPYKTGNKNSALLFIIAAVVIIAAVAIAFVFLGAQQPTPGAQPPGNGKPGAQTPPANGSLPGAVPDVHGCIPANGYVWCESTQKCFRPFDENCSSMPSTPAPQQNAGNASAPAPPSTTGNTSASSALPQPLGSGNASAQPLPASAPNISSGNQAVPVPSFALNMSANHGCDSSKGYYWCEANQKCFQPPGEYCLPLPVTSKT